MEIRWYFIIDRRLFTTFSHTLFIHPGIRNFAQNSAMFNATTLQTTKDKNPLADDSYVSSLCVHVQVLWGLWWGVADVYLKWRTFVYIYVSKSCYSPLYSNSVVIFTRHNVQDVFFFYTETPTGKKFPVLNVYTYTLELLISSIKSIFISIYVLSSIRELG